MLNVNNFTLSKFTPMCEEKKFVLWGGGKIGIKTILCYLKDRKDSIAYMVDTNPNMWNKYLLGVPVKSPEHLFAEERDSVVVCIAVGDSHKREIDIQLRMGGFSNIITTDIFFTSVMSDIKEHIKERSDVLHLNSDKIDAVRALLNDERSLYVLDKYLEKLKKCDVYYGDIQEWSNYTSRYYNNILSNEEVTEREVLVDVGASTGSTIWAFLQYANTKRIIVHACEPHTYNYHHLCAEIGGLSEDFNIHNVAISDKKGSLPFGKTYADQYAGNLEDEGFHTVDVSPLDDLIDDDVTFMKLNLQGFECKGLLGAERIITQHKPKIACCAYANHEDLFQVPLMLHDLLPEYKLYLRFHSYGNCHEGAMFYAKI